MITPLRQCANGGIRIASDGLALGCCDACEQLKSRIVAMCEQRGFYCLHKTGYLYHLTDTTTPLVKSTLHWISWTIENSVYVWRLNSIDCDCNVQIVAEVRGVSVVSIADLGYGFFASEDACDGLCEDEIAILVAQAINNGWEILGAGVLARRTSAQYSCYRFDLGMIPVSLCVDTGTSLKYVGCDCYVGEIESSYGLWGYLEYDACRCLEIRELILSYPSEFGVDDVSFGDDTVYTYDKSQSTGFVETYSCLEHSTSYDTWFCDYRSMYVIFDNSCIGRPNDSGYGSYTPDYFLMKFDTDGRWLGGDSYPLKYEDVTNGTLYFDGKVQPFTTSEHNKEIWPHSSNLNWKGLTIRWEAENSHFPFTETFWERQEAQNELDDYNSSPNKYGVNEFSAHYSNEGYFYEPSPSVTPPAISATHVEGYIEYDSVNEVWILHKPHDEFNGDSSIVYSLNFVQTNKGFLVNGGDGSFSETLAVYGLTDTIPSWTYSPTEQQLITQYEAVMARCGSGDGLPTPCPEGAVKEIDYTSSIMEIPLYDMSYKVTPDESMGGCQSKDWWDAIIGQYDEDEE